MYDLGGVCKNLFPTAAVNGKLNVGFVYLILYSEKEEFCVSGLQNQLAAVLGYAEIPAVQSQHTA